MKVVWAMLLTAACITRFPQQATLSRPAPGLTFRVPEDADTISEAISAGGTVIELGAGEFDLGTLDLGALPYTIRGSGSDRTKVRTNDGTPFPGAKGMSLTFSDLTLEKLGPGFMPFTEVALDLRHVHLIGGLRITGGAVDIRDSLLNGGLYVTEGSLHIARSTLSAGASAGLQIWVSRGMVDVSLERVAVTSSEVGASLRCMSNGRYNVTLDHSVFYRNRFAAVLAQINVIKDGRACGELTIRDSMFIENRGVAIERHGAEVVAAHNFAWQNARGNYRNWTLQEPFVEVDPMFVDPARGDFRFQAGSPAIAAGVGVVDPGVRFASADAREVESSAKPAGPVPAGPARGVKNGRKLALVVGIQDYQDPAIKDLKYARRDAESIAHYLRDTGYTVNLLTEASASVPAVKNALISLTHANPGDSVFIYFSVHGSGESNPLGTGRGFLLLSDAQAKSVPSTALPVQDIQAAVDHTASDRVVLILDSCFSGGASDRAKSIWTAVNTKGDGESITGSVVNGRGKIGLFSSRDNEVSLEADELKHGYFTYYLLQAWGRGLRSLDEVYPYVLREVENSTKGQQHPRFSSAQAEGQPPTF